MCHNIRCQLKKAYLDCQWCQVQGLPSFTCAGCLTIIRRIDKLEEFNQVLEDSYNN